MNLAACENCWDYPCTCNPTITYRGSVTDLATDAAYLLTPEQGAELVRELQRFLMVLPAKFQGKGRR